MVQTRSRAPTKITTALPSEQPAKATRAKKRTSSAAATSTKRAPRRRAPPTRIQKRIIVSDEEDEGQDDVKVEQTETAEEDTTPLPSASSSPQEPLPSVLEEEPPASPDTTIVKDEPAMEAPVPEVEPQVLPPSQAEPEPSPSPTSRAQKKRKRSPTDPATADVLREPMLRRLRPRIAKEEPEAQPAPTAVRKRSTRKKARTQVKAEVVEPEAKPDLVEDRRPLRSSSDLPPPSLPTSQEVIDLFSDSPLSLPPSSPPLLPVDIKLELPSPVVKTRIMLSASLMPPSSPIATEETQPTVLRVEEQRWEEPAVELAPLAVAALEAPAAVEPSEDPGQLPTPQLSPVTETDLDLPQTPPDLPPVAADLTPNPVEGKVFVPWLPLDQLVPNEPGIAEHGIPAALSGSDMDVDVAVPPHERITPEPIPSVQIQQIRAALNNGDVREAERPSPQATPESVTAKDASASSIPLQADPPTVAGSTAPIPASPALDPAFITPPTQSTPMSPPRAPAKVSFLLPDVPPTPESPTPTSKTPHANPTLFDSPKASPTPSPSRYGYDLFGSPVTPVTRPQTNLPAPTTSASAPSILTSAHGSAPQPDAAPEARPEPPREVTASRLDMLVKAAAVAHARDFPEAEASASSLGPKLDVVVGPSRARARTRKPTAKAAAKGETEAEAAADAEPMPKPKRPRTTKPTTSTTADAPKAEEPPLKRARTTAPAKLRAKTATTAKAKAKPPPEAKPKSTAAAEPAAAKAKAPRKPRKTAPKPSS